MPNPYLDNKKNNYNKYDIVNQSKISLQNNSLINSESTNFNDNVKVLQSQNFNRMKNLSLNKNESQILSLINSNKISDSKDTFNNNNNSSNISKTLNNFFKEKNPKKQGSRKINKLIKSSSTEC